MILISTFSSFFTIYPTHFTHPLLAMSISIHTAPMGRPYCRCFTSIRITTWKPTPQAVGRVSSVSEHASSPTEELALNPTWRRINSSTSSIHVTADKLNTITSSPSPSPIWFIPSQNPSNHQGRLWGKRIEIWAGPRGKPGAKIHSDIQPAGIPTGRVQNQHQLKFWW